MNNYNFMTIHTLVDISKGNIPQMGEPYVGCFTNISRLIDFILCHSPPFLTRVEKELVNFDKAKNCNYYKMPNLRGTGTYTVYTFKFAVTDMNVDLFSSCINRMPLITPTNVTGRVLRQYITEDGPDKNTTVVGDRLTTTRLS